MYRYECVYFRHLFTPNLRIKSETEKKNYEPRSNNNADERKKPNAHTHIYKTGEID